MYVYSQSKQDHGDDRVRGFDIVYENGAARKLEHCPYVRTRRFSSPTLRLLAPHHEEESGAKTGVPWLFVFPWLRSRQRPPPRCPQFMPQSIHYVVREIKCFTMMLVISFSFSFCCDFVPICDYLLVVGSVGGWDHHPGGVFMLLVLLVGGGTVFQSFSFMCTICVYCNRCATQIKYYLCRVSV